MKAVRLRSRGGPDALIHEEAPVPKPGSGEVLVRVHAAAVTPTELEWLPTWTTRAGEPRPFPIVPGHEFSGQVHAVGSDVTNLAAGNEVFGLNDWFSDGAQAEFCVARAVDVALKPKSLDHLRAAMMPISALTAWQGLIDRAQLASGERVLVHGAAGSVGLFAVQIARRCGAHVTGTAAAHNLDFIRGLGADLALDYKSERFEDIARDMDVIFDTVGGDTLARSWDVLRTGGRLVTVATAGEQTKDERVRNAFFIVEPNRAELERLAAMTDAGELRPIVDAVFPLSDARRAYEHKPLRGKVVLSVP
jgi:NADPH:quinone reductase-like Zn-dependent oxidoreductase